MKKTMNKTSILLSLTLILSTLQPTLGLANARDMGNVPAGKTPIQQQTQGQTPSNSKVPTQDPTQNNGGSTTQNPTQQQTQTSSVGKSNYYDIHNSISAGNAQIVGKQNGGKTNTGDQPTQNTTDPTQNPPNGNIVYVPVYVSKKAAKEAKKSGNGIQMITEEENCEEMRTTALRIFRAQYKAQKKNDRILGKNGIYVSGDGQSAEGASAMNRFPMRDANGVVKYYPANYSCYQELNRRYPKDLCSGKKGPFNIFKESDADWEKFLSKAKPASASGEPSECVAIGETSSSTTSTTASTTSSKKPKDSKGEGAFIGNETTTNEVVTTEGKTGGVTNAPKVETTQAKVVTETTNETITITDEKRKEVPAAPSTKQEKVVVTDAPVKKEKEVPAAPSTKQEKVVVTDAPVKKEKEVPAAPSTKQEKVVVTDAPVKKEKEVPAAPSTKQEKVVVTEKKGKEVPAAPSAKKEKVVVTDKKEKSSVKEEMNKMCNFKTRTIVDVNIMSDEKALKLFNGLLDMMEARHLKLAEKLCKTSNINYIPETEYINRSEVSPKAVVGVKAESSKPASTKEKELESGELT